MRVSLWPMLDNPPDFRGRRFELEDPGLAVDEDTIQSHLDQYRDQFAELETVQRTSVTGDYVAIDLYASHDGRPVEELSVSDFLYEVGSDVLLEDLGTRPGGHLRRATSFSSRPGCASKRAAWKPARESIFEALVKEVKEKRLPELDDEWAADFTEFDTVEELRNDIAERIESSRLSVLRTRFQAKVVTELTDEVDVDIPRAVIDVSVNRMLERLHTRLAGGGDVLRGITSKPPSKVRKPSSVGVQEQATRQIRTQVLLDSIAVDAGLEVEDGELRQAYEQAGTEMGETAEDLSRRLAGSVQEMNLMGDILRTKALEALMHGAVATDHDGNVLDLQFEVPDGAEIVEAETEQGDQ